MNRKLKRFSLLPIALLMGVLAVGCGGEDSNNTTDDATEFGNDTVLEMTTGGYTVVALDENWTAGAQDEGCDVCSSCGSTADCGPNELCWDTGGGKVCTMLCDAGSCPGNSRCFDVTNTDTERTTALCINGEAELSVCPATYSCSPVVGPMPDMEMDMEPQECADTEPGICRYCGTPDGVVRTCPESDDSLACQVFRITNVERSAMGLPALRYDGLLAESSQLHSIDMAVCDYFEHEALDGRSPADRITAVGYPWVTMGENIAVGQRSSSEVMTAWMNSPGHRANILQVEFTEIGVGVFDSPNGIYWTQNFGRR